MEQIEIHGANQQERSENVEFAYLAGIIDGEGCISVKTQGRDKERACLTPSVVIVNTSEDMINWIHSLLLRSEIQHFIHQKIKQPERKNIYRLIIKGSGRVLRVLEKTERFLVAKRKQAQLVKDLCIRKLEKKSRPRISAEILEDRNTLIQIRTLNKVFGHPQRPYVEHSKQE